MVVKLSVGVASGYANNEAEVVEGNPPVTYRSGLGNLRRAGVNPTKAKGKGKGKIGHRYVTL